jgi:hypothetical protein
MTVFSSGVFGVWERGVRSPGGNRYVRLKIVPRPGSTRVGVGAMDGFHSFNQQCGPTLIDCEISRVHDDGVNIHGFVNVVLGTLPDHKYILASIHGRDYDVGSELFLHRAPDMAPLGAAKVSAWEPFDSDEGMPLYGSMRKRFMDEFGTKIRGVIQPEFNVVSFEQSVSLNALDMACSQEYCGKGARISNLYIHTGCSRGVIVRAPGAVIENSRFENIEFGGLALCTSLSTFLEGGFPNYAKILNNSFENCGGKVFGGAFMNGVVWGFWGAISISPSTPPQGQAAFLHLSPHVLYHDIEIRGNRIEDTQGLPIFVGNSRNVTVADNLIIKPFQASREKLAYLDLMREGIITPQYSPPVPEDLTLVLKEPFYGVFVSASENVNFSGNNIVDAPLCFRGMVGVGPWSKNVGMELGVSP